MNFDMSCVCRARASERFRSKASQMGWRTPGEKECLEEGLRESCVPEGFQGSRQVRDGDSWCLDLDLRPLREEGLRTERADSVENMEFNKDWGLVSEMVGGVEMER